MPHTKIILIEDEFSPRQMLRDKLERHFPEYLLKAFELAAIDYLVKPVSVDKLQKTIARYRQRVGSTTGLQNLMDALDKEKLLKFKSFNGLFLLRPDDIVYVEADRDYACMFFANGTKEDIQKCRQAVEGENRLVFIC